MKSLQQKVLKFIDKQTLIPPGSRVLVACSGGVDSIALLHFLATHQQFLAIEVGAIHVDHMLRGAESAEDAFVVKQLCEEFGLPFYSEQVPIRAILESQGGNMQQVCRQQRYARFEQTMKSEQFTVLATAHHADDQLETVLIQLSKGQSLNGMPIQRAFHSGKIVRPFLPLKKSELYTYTTQCKIKFREDPSNQQDYYLRNRMRHQVLPLLIEENPSVAVNTVRQTEQRQADEKLLSELASQHWQSIVTYTDEQLPSFQREAFLAIPHALQKRVIQLLLKCLTEPATENAEWHFTLVDELLQHITNTAGNVTIDLANDYRFIRQYDKLLVTKKDIDTASLRPKVLEKGTWHTWGNIQFYWHHVNAHRIQHFLPSDEIRYFQLPKSELPLTARLRITGDRMLLKGMSEPKRIKRILIDEKIGIVQRQQQPVITTASGTVCAVPGVRYGEMFSRCQLEGDSYIWITREGETR
ncbi:tRNA lysidine(34) synthetase TilS [Sporosarcina sp. P26b]|uniref:tRNA lysidine(34) synthetase TilS n=1 Tax=Sporosarcina sp. P26b TaxID=2048253 RepID=UPI000C162DDF|nr:tRNA lysidine(34) synthetase TilS [Sporosarcina sp. P26b]PIC95540.1 tRNA lysidine(34) synthetase TilS [Sporosarcina sp. P26b]